jgi:phosphopantothenoylcysteine decarboxylase/phosphopantothenate--cysteine ligase
VNIIVTAGATREPIDGIRFVSNLSSGKTATAIARFISKHVDRVFFLHASYMGPIAAKNITNYSYGDYHSLRDGLTKVFKKTRVDAVIQCAAVSDYTIDYMLMNGKKIEVTKDKLSSKGLTAIYLKESPKLIDLPFFRDTLLVAFKLTNSSSHGVRREAIRRLLANPNVDILVHNDLSEITAQKHIATIYTPRGQTMVKNKLDLSRAIYRAIKGLI